VPVLTNWPTSSSPEARLRAARRRAEYRVCVVTGLAGKGGELAWTEATDVLLADNQPDPFPWIVLGWPRRPTNRCSDPTIDAGQQPERHARRGLGRRAWLPRRRVAAAQ
jgi:hypothetical protein